MEKYGVDMDELPVTDDQIRELRELYDGKIPAKVLRSRKTAEEAIEGMKK